MRTTFSSQKLLQTTLFITLHIINFNYNLSTTDTEKYIYCKEKNLSSQSLWKKVDRQTDILNPSTGVCGATRAHWTGINPQFYSLSTE